MNIYFILIFFPLILFGIYFLSVKLNSSRVSKMVVELLSTCTSTESIEEIGMKFQENDGMKGRVWPKGFCDIHFCENFAIVLKRHHFGITFKSKPIVFGPEIPARVSRQEKILVKAEASKVKRGEFYLIFADRNFGHYRYELTLFGLNTQQVERLNCLAGWMKSE